MDVKPSSELRVIVMASQKGGAGKTTMSGHIAVEAERAGAGPVAIIDTDNQGSLANWWNVRAAQTPAFVQTNFSELFVKLEGLREMGFRVAVIDTPPAVTRAISEVISHADLVVMPTRPSPHDLRAVGATVDIVEAHGKEMVFVINGATPRANLTAEAALALAEHGVVAPVTLHHRVDWAASMTDGRTVMEANPRGRSAREMRKLWRYLRERLDNPEPRQAQSSARPSVSVGSVAATPAQAAASARRFGGPARNIPQRTFGRRVAG